MKLHAFSPEFSITNYLGMVQQFVGLFSIKTHASAVNVDLFHLTIFYLHFTPPSVTTELRKIASRRPLKFIIYSSEYVSKFRAVTHSLAVTLCSYSPLTVVTLHAAGFW